MIKRNLSIKEDITSVFSEFTTVIWGETSTAGGGIWGGPVD